MDTLTVEKVARGHLLLVQESRFRLSTEEGQGLLLTLAHNANVDEEELHRFHHEGTRLEVRYKGEPNLVSGVAHRVTAIP